MVLPLKPIQGDVHLIFLTAFSRQLSVFGFWPLFNYSNLFFEDVSAFI
jgi:hypothetical protein